MAQSKYTTYDFVGGDIDYQQSLAQEQLTDSNISYWESLLQPAQTQLETSLTTAETNAGYDILNAYKNYLQQQRAIQDSNLLGTSQSLLTKEARSGYESAYAQAQSGLLSSTASAYQQYAKDYETAYKTLAEEATKIKDIDTAIWNYAVDNLDLSEEELGKVYDYNPETKTKSISDFGRSVYQQILETTEDNKNLFGEKLRMSNEDLYNYYMQNQDRIKNILAGYTSSTYNKGNRPLEMEREKNKPVEEKPTSKKRGRFSTSMLL